MDLILGGTAAAAAGAICNPLEVVKIRMQLQGELQARGMYFVHYRNVFHAAYTIGTKDGILALQKGVVPFAIYQFALCSARLGLYQMAVERGLTLNRDGTKSSTKAFGITLFCGAIGGVLCSPFFLVKTHLQSQANEISIAVGHQHQHRGMISALVSIYKKHGIRGLWRGTSSMIPRIAIANASQLLTFEATLDFMKLQFPGRPWTALVVGCFTSGLFMAACCAPVDLVATRLYNQGVDACGKGLLYRSVFDCTVKVYRQEGATAFLKGFSAGYFRSGPYSIFLLIFWDRLKYYYHRD